MPGERHFIAHPSHLGAQLICMYVQKFNAKRQFAQQYGQKEKEEKNKIK